MDLKTGISEPTVVIPIGLDCRDIPNNFIVIDGPTIITPPVKMVLIDRSYYQYLSKHSEE